MEISAEILSMDKLMLLFGVILLIDNLNGNIVILFMKYLLMKRLLSLSLRKLLLEKIMILLTEDPNIKQQVEKFVKNGLLNLLTATLLLN